MTGSSNPSRNTSSQDETFVLVKSLVGITKSFESEAHRILATHESSASRVITIEDTYKQLSSLSLKQEGLLKESIACVSNSSFKAAHVLAWAALMDYVEEKLGEDAFKKLAVARPNWNIASLEDLRDIGSDYQIIESLRKIGLCGKTVEKALIGLLSKRNECAHPTGYNPGLNETLGYISEVLNRLKSLETKHP
jgi:hypothetical protein